MSPRFRSVPRSVPGFWLAVLLVGIGCTTGGPILTGTSPLASPTPTPAPAATPTSTPTPLPTATPIPTPGTGPDLSITIVEGSITLQSGFIAIFDPFTLDQAGSLTFTADWTSSLNDIDIALASGSCTPTEFSASTCTFAGAEESSTMKPELLTLPLPAGAYTPLIGNFSVADEVITYRIVFTSNPSASLGDARALAAAAAARLGQPVLVRTNGKLSSRRR